MKKSIFKADKKYTFKDYFDMPYPIEEIIAALGYQYQLSSLTLPQSQQFNHQAIQELQKSFYTVLPKVNLSSEAARREFLISPLLFEMAKETDVKFYIEYPVEVNHLLSGYLDYLIYSPKNLIVIEAKRGDLDKGFNQLAAELIALDMYEADCQDELFYGVVTVGDIWRFAVLNRKQKKISRDMRNYTIPEHVEEIFSILIGITR